MHKKLQNIINNCSSQIDFHKSQDNRLKNSNLFENAKIKRFIQIYWDDVEELNSTIQIPISRENFIDE